MYALIQKDDNKILRVSAEGALLADSKPFQWVDCPEETKVNWLYDGSSFTAPPQAVPSLEEKKAEKRQRINAKRDEKEASGFLYNGVSFDSDQRSANRILCAAIAAQAALVLGQPLNVDWTAADNSVVPLDAAGIVGLAVALAQAGTANFYTAKALKQQVDVAQTPEAVDAVPLP